MSNGLYAGNMAENHIARCSRCSSAAECDCHRVYPHEDADDDPDEEHDRRREETKVSTATEIKLKDCIKLYKEGKIRIDRNRIKSVQIPCRRLTSQNRRS